MKVFLRLIAVAFLGVILSACGGNGEPTMDTTDDESVEASYSAIIANLSSDEREQFDEALGNVYMMGALERMESGMSEDEIMDELNEEVHGKTADEIIAMAEESEKVIRERMQEMQQAQ